MMLKKVFLVFLLMVMALPTYADTEHSSGTLYALLMVKTEDEMSEAKDPKPAWKLSLGRIEKELDRVEEYTSLRVKRIYFTGSNFDGEQLQAYIKQMQVSTNDVIWFYFAGHGFGNNACRYPQLVASRQKVDGQKIYGSGAELTESDVALSSCSLHNSLKAKKPRLLISLLETCNYNVDDDPFGGKLELLEDFKAENYQVLFEETIGNLYITASKTGQLAGWNTEIGGFFTEMFLTELHNRLDNPKTVAPCDWYIIGSKTMTRLRKWTKANERVETQILYGEVEIYESLQNKFEENDELNCRPY